MSFMVFIQTEESEQIEKIIMINEFNFDFNFDLNLITVKKIQGKRNIFYDTHIREYEQITKHLKITQIKGDISSQA